MNETNVGEQLYNNVYEMQSSDYSPSRRSFLSYGEESRIDSELRYLAGVDFGELDIKKEVSEEDKNEKNSPLQNRTVDPSNKEGYLGPYLLKQARDMISTTGENLQKALELALRAMKSFESSSREKSSLEFVMCLHVVAALNCRLGKYSEAIPLLERSIEIPDLDLEVKDIQALGEKGATRFGETCQKDHQPLLKKLLTGALGDLSLIEERL
ncbi:Tetratricopeptide repeat protein 19, mitochondrial [Datura stramonium]|uniref:Tetratricopeptide repeat protein 19, mitochondrial n=1 Tax=Datura stramonium TaxID=4076 RepID=A0ABS8UJG2_DATST|nr:Tetratricopeptide repeat protein 19, mitochondrial [Datura stramonium]